MTSLRQIEANRRNARKSTGPITEAGKQRSRKNAVRHGLTAETVIGLLEDAADYRAFEAAIIADYDGQTCVQRELVLRLASLLWRLRRATSMETGLFEIQAGHLQDFRLVRELDQRKKIHAIFGQSAEPNEAAADLNLGGITQGIGSEGKSTGPELSRCFLRLANLPSCPLDRLSRYEGILWRQACQILFALEAFTRRKPIGRWSHLPLGVRQQLPSCDDSEC